MSGQNRYRIERDYKKVTGERRGWKGWIDDDYHETADTWQNAIHQWVDDMWWRTGEYQVVSETQTEDGRSGIIEITFREAGLWVEVKVKATLIED